MDNNSIMNIAREGVTYLQSTVPGVVGALLTTLFLRKNTGTTEFEKIKAGKFNEALELLLNNGKMTYFEYYKCRNFLKIAELADEYKETNKETEDTKKLFDFDWFLRFFEASGNISDEEIQQLWSKVLAGEISRPGDFSLRSLDILRNLSKTEANALKTLASYAIPFGDEYYISIDTELMKRYDYQTKLKEMYDCDIIENYAVHTKSFTMHQAGLFVKVGSLACFTHFQGEEKFSLDMQRFTRMGKECIKLVSPDQRYSLDFFRVLNKNNPKLNLTVHSIEKESEEAFEYSHNDLLV